MVVSAGSPRWNVDVFVARSDLPWTYLVKCQVYQNIINLWPKPLFNNLEMQLNFFAVQPRRFGAVVSRLGEWRLCIAAESKESQIRNCLLWRYWDAYSGAAIWLFIGKHNCNEVSSSIQTTWNKPGRKKSGNQATCIRVLAIYERTSCHGTNGCDTNLGRKSSIS